MTRIEKLLSERPNLDFVEHTNTLMDLDSTDAHETPDAKAIIEEYYDFGVISHNSTNNPQDSIDAEVSGETYIQVMFDGNYSRALRLIAYEVTGVYSERSAA